MSDHTEQALARLEKNIQKESGKELHTLTWDHQSEKKPSGESSKLTSRWNAFWGSPRTVMVLVPLLVLVLGLTLTIIGQIALNVTSKTMAKERFAEESGSASLRMEQALSQADPILDELGRLAEHSLPDTLQTQNHDLVEAGLSSLALQMRDMLVARRAITQVYLALPDGTFIGANREVAGRLDFQLMRQGRSTHYEVRGAQLVEVETRESSYDPRTRAWFQKAVTQKQRIWSEPYVFYFNHHPGVTRSEALFRDEEQKRLRAVVAVDFDVEALTAFMASGESGEESAHSVVFSENGIVVAYPHGASALPQLTDKETLPTHAAFQDPGLSALIDEVLSRSPSNRRLEFHRYLADEQTMLASVRPMGATGPRWYVGIFAREASILHELHTHRAQSLWVGGFALLLATLLGWLLARYLFRVKAVATQAQAAAQRAQEQIRNLGSYRLLSLLGEGGMGEVWRARHRLLAREAAIKLIKLNEEDDRRIEEHRERFRREAQAISGLRSRNTVALFDYGVTEHGTLYYVMELLDGLDLSTLVHQHGAQSPDRVRKILIQACASLAEAHKAQLVHRDIKPANLFLCREANEVDIVKVLDFGLVFQTGEITPAPDADVPTLDLKKSELQKQSAAKNMLRESLENIEAAGSSDPEGRITNPNHHLGTPAYMSPEQAMGNATDHRTDIYSLGCVAWYLLTGKPPFSAANQVALMLAQIDEALPELSPLAPEISDEFKDVIVRCLQKSPKDRPQSAQDLAKELRQLSPGGAPWSTESAETWWQTHRPANTGLTPHLSLAPHPDAAFLRPKRS